MNYNELLDIDDTDKEIIEILQKKPESTHSAIAEKVHKSQPAVGARIIKLKRKFLLTETIGSEINKIDIKFARIELSTKNVEPLWNSFQNCPFIINSFKMTGEYNLLIEIVAPNVRTIENFIDNCLRKNKSILDIRTNFVIDSLRKYIVPLHFEIEKFENSGCSYECGEPLSQDNLERIISSN